MIPISNKVKEIKELVDKGKITKEEYKILIDEILEDEFDNIFWIPKNKQNKQTFSYTIIKFPPKYIIFFIILFLILSFHIVPSRLSVFPKENFTLSNTYISEGDINKIISRYNNASVMERTIMLQDPLINKLFEKDILVEKSSPEKEYSPVLPN